jgi:hypothetical protein
MEPDSYLLGQTNNITKRRIIIIMKNLLLIAAVTLFSTTACAKGDFNELSDFPKESISSAEKEGLLLMREEEKLARDVYAELYDTWKLKTFENISKSEEQHMNAVGELLKRYNISDPVKSDARGVYQNSELSKLYKELTRRGKISLAEALTVGAMIEDLDIKDLNELLKKTDNKDITFVYNNLKRGSENHIRSFTRQLEREGKTYTPQFISSEEYNSIISTNGSRGNGNGNNRNKNDDKEGSGYGSGNGNGNGQNFHENGQNGSGKQYAANTPRGNGRGKRRSNNN